MSGKVAAVRKGVSLHLREPFKRALDALKAKYGASATQILEHLLEADLLANEPEIAQECGIAEKPPNRFAAGARSTWNINAGQAYIPGLPHLPNTQMPWNPVPNTILPSPDAEIPPSQRVRP